MQLTDFSRAWGIALTGGIASGKSTIAGLLRQRSYLVIDADQLSRELTAPQSEGLAAVALHFGSQVLHPDGSLDRAQMRRIIFNDAQQRAALEAIIHPRLEQSTLRVLREHGLLDRPRLWFYEAALIFERDRAQDFLEVWVAHCDPEVQIARLMARDHATRAEALAIIAAQLPLSEKLKRADRAINTNGTLLEIGQQVDVALTAVSENKKTSR